LSGAGESGGQPRRFAVHGTGRMARAIAAAAANRSDVMISALVGPQAPDWDTNARWYGRLEELTGRPALLIDFTLPQGTLAAANWCRVNGVPLLSGVTGLPAEAQDALRQAASCVPVLWSPNLSLGVNLLADLARRAAAVLDPQTPVLIEDIHHQWKKDAPSGTALMLGAAVAEQRDGDERAIEYRSLREGEVIGEHTVRFSMAGESFDLVHRAQDRSIYALGALEAGAWLLGQPAGLYSARDWLAGR
jgi:4-hydroxy-tetrahydrodipicolinate reductase